jgi:NTP pyrophosphatase (non-canonical NTP hydrolase)
MMSEASSAVFDRWIGQAAENIEEWGLQDEETLLLAIQEELGELTQAYLEATHEAGDPSRVSEELDDLGALLLQLHESHTDSGENPGECE